jgi:polyribonucleotide nucleotidyltransferase
MAAVCGSSLALFDAGVPIPRPLAGISIGLATKNEERPEEQYELLTDIQGPEDHHGDMDCKVAGTEEGITAIQLDTKVRGLTTGMLSAALERAKEARIQILAEMKKVLPAPRAELSPYAPRVYTIQINPEKIREVIGPGGKVINQITGETGVTIDIEDSGLIFITSTNKEEAEKAREWIHNITREVVPGEVFTGRVVRILNFGAFVEILPGQQGLVHISELSSDYVKKVEDIVRVGDMVRVKVRNIDTEGRINLSMKDTSPSAREQAQEVV